MKKQRQSETRTPLEEPRPAQRRPRGIWGRRLDRLAKRNNWTMDELASALGVPPRTCQDWCRGLRRPSASARALIEAIEKKTGRKQ
jgi:DNA-binding transcriptional regulator YiaG